MLSPSVRKKLKEILGLLIFLIFVALVTLVSIYFEITLALPAFLASLFFIYVLSSIKYSKFKNILGSYLIAMVFGYLGLMLLSPLLENLSTLTAGVIEISLITFLVGLLTIIFSIEHPPALASVVFWVLADISRNELIGFGICLLIILIKGITTKIMRKRGLAKLPDFDLEEDFGDEPDLKNFEDIK